MKMYEKELQRIYLSIIKNFEIINSYKQNDFIYCQGNEIQLSIWSTRQNGMQGGRIEIMEKTHPDMKVKFLELAKREDFKFKII